MSEAEQTPIRLRHYTRTSSRDRILAEGWVRARDQHKVFVERASRPPLSPRQAEARYLLKRGKGNVYAEFNAMPTEVHEQTHPLTGAVELFWLWKKGTGKKGTDLFSPGAILVKGLRVAPEAAGGKRHIRALPYLDEAFP